MISSDMIGQELSNYATGIRINIGERVNPETTNVFDPRAMIRHLPLVNQLMIDIPKGNEPRLKPLVS